MNQKILLVDSDPAALICYRQMLERDFDIATAASGEGGVVLKRREALQKLLKDVLSGDANYRAILDYDVSRWGRFPNNDETAHYEFLCSRSGIPLHYCAEPFANDGTPSS